MRLLFIFTKIVGFIEIKVKLPNVRNNFSQQINPRQDCIISKNTDVSLKTEKSGIEKFLNTKRI